MEQRISIDRLEQAVNIFGSFDENIRLLEKEFEVTVVNREGELRVEGEEENVARAARAVQALLTLSSRGEIIGEQNVRYVIGLVRSGKEDQIAELTQDVLCITAKGRPSARLTYKYPRFVSPCTVRAIVVRRGTSCPSSKFLWAYS